MSENDGSSKSSSGPSSDSSRMNSTTGSAGGSSGGNSAGGPSSHTESGSSLHSHMSLKGASACCTSATSDSAYGGSNSQSQRSGSGSGSRSSKSQISSNSSNNAGAEQQSKSRKEKEPKKRKSNVNRSVPLVHSPAAVPDKPVSPVPNKAAPLSTSNVITPPTAMATAMDDKNSSSPSGTGVADSTGHTGGNGPSVGMNPKVALLTGPNVTPSRAVQAAQLSRALNCLKATGLTPNKQSHSSKCGKEDTTTSSWRSILIDPLEASLKKTFAHLEEVPTVKAKEAFIAAISLQDGIVVYVTPSLTDKLGYPVEMWCGRSLLDFIHPKDRLAFTNQITSKLLASLDKDESSSGYSFSSDEALFPRCTMVGSSSSPPNTLCCRLRMYRGLRTSGFGIVDKKTSYMPFRIILNLEKIRLPQDSNDTSDNKDTEKVTGAKNPEGDDADSTEYYLLAYAVPITTAYKTSDEKNSTGQFGLRHSSNCTFSEVDMSSVPYLGHLPQDLLGMSALEFYHPSDLPELKKVYDSVIGRQGKSIRSKPYNFRAFNGCYVLLETDWTCFVNPWTKKLEFVAGHHRVLKGPSNPDVFASPPEGSACKGDTIDAETLEKTKKLQDEICTILTGSAKTPQKTRPSSNTVDTALIETATRRRKNIATLMGSLMDEVAKARGSNSCGNSCSSSIHARCKPLLRSPVEEGSFLGDASVVMGDISTHGGSNIDSNSADTPLSYSLLNYNQNLERYFQSQPKMIPSDGSGESSGAGSADSKPNKHQTPNMSSEEEGGCVSTVEHTSSGTLPSTDSQKLSSSQSNSNSTDSQNGMAYDPDFKGLPLTKEILGRHNEEMEKEFMQQHRELRNRSTPGHRSGQLHIKKETQGVKRGQAPSWEEGGAGGRHKHPHMDELCTTPHCYQSPSTGTALGPFNDWASLTGPSLIPSNLLPPFSVSSTAPNQPSALFSVPITNRGEVTNSLPAFYLAAPGAAPNTAIRPGAGLPLAGTQYMMPGQHHQPLGPAFSLQPYAAYPHGVIYQPVMMPPMLFQPGMGMMMPTSHPMTPQAQQTPHSRSGHSHDYPTGNRQQQTNPAAGLYRDNFGASSSFRLDSGSLASSSDQSPSFGGYRQHFFRDSQGGSRQQTPENHGHPQGLHPAGGGHQPPPTPKRIPPWMEAVSVSNELVYKYQVPGRNTTDVLQADRERLQMLQQPVLLNRQLEQLYIEMEAEQRSGVELALEESENSTSSSNTEESSSRRRELRRRSAEFRRTMLYEENAPFPRPESSTDG